MRLVRCAIIMVLCLLFIATGTATAEKSSGSIAGQVFDVNGEGLAGALVEAYTCKDAQAHGTVISNAGGEYLFGLEDGCYVVRFAKNGYQSAWYGGSPLKDEATEVVVTGKEVNGLDGDLSEAGAVISGQVKTRNGQPLANAWATAIQVGVEGISASDAVTDEKGHYAIDVASGSYIVIFVRTGHVVSLYGGSLKNPQMVEAVMGRTSAGIDAILSEGGRLSGRVTDENGKGLAEIGVMTITEEAPASAKTKADGRFTIDGVPTGEHRILFVDPQEEYQQIFYGGTADPQTAKLVKVIAPKTVTGIKATLQRSGGISGWVTDASGNGLGDVMIFAHATALNLTKPGMATTTENGQYTMKGLAAGEYTLSFRSPNKMLLPRFYPDSTDPQSAQPVVVTTGTITFGINQQLPNALALTGQVRNPEGEPLAEVSVRAFDPSGDSFRSAGRTTSDAAGQFMVPLPPGEYIVQFGATGPYMGQWSGGQTQRENAESVIVSAEEPVTLDMVLLRGGSITGKVRNRVGKGLTGISIEATDLDSGESAGRAKSDENGIYQLQALPAGQYRLVATGDEQGYVREKRVHPVTVETQARVKQIDFVMTEGGSISGKVTNLDGNPIWFTNVEVYDPATWSVVADSRTDQTGAYQIGGLPSGTYTIRFENSAYMVQWFNDKSRREDADKFSIVGTSSFTGLDARLTTGYSLSGIVTNEQGIPLDDAEVGIYGEAEDEPFNEVHTGNDGRFIIPNLSAGNYRVRFGHDHHIPAWYGGRHRHEAKTIVVSETENSDLKAILTMSGVKVAGKLTNSDGEDVGQAWMTVIDAETHQPVADERICECSGKFNIPLEPGRYRLRVERHGKEYWYGDAARGESQVLQVDGVVSGLRMLIGGD